MTDSGRMPTLRRLVENGASGSLLSGQPLVPAEQWTSLVTGKRPWQHQVCHQFELDEGAQRRVPISAAHRTAATLWEMLGREGKKSLIVGWPATQRESSERATNLGVITVFGAEVELHNRLPRGPGARPLCRLNEGIGDLRAGGRHAGFVYNPLNQLEYFLLTWGDIAHGVNLPIPD